LDLEFGVTHKGPQKLIQAENLGKKSFQDSEAWLFRHLNLVLTVKTRMALLGPNGIGKSTLIRTFLGLEKVDEGSVQQAEKMEIGFFEQGRDSLLLDKSVLKNLCPEGDYVTFQGSSLHVRSYLDRFRFDKTKADLPVRQLSGGEQARLRLAQLMLKECKILVLDEPTNDLDMETLDFLQEALQEFKGALILVTHDRYFMDQVVDQILAFDAFAAGQGKLLTFADSEQWERWYNEEQQNQRNPKAEASVSVGESAGKNGKLSYKEKLEWEGMELKIQDSELLMESWQKESENPAVIADAKKLQELYLRIGQIQAELEKLYSRWAELEAKAKKP
jgi:ATP-binding cassette subfamily F protein uup